MICMIRTTGTTPIANFIQNKSGCAAKLMQIRFNYLAAGHTEEEWKTYVSERLRRACVESIKEVTQVAKPREESRETNGYSSDEV